MKLRPVTAFGAGLLLSACLASSLLAVPDAQAAAGTPSASAVRSGEWWLSQMGIEKAWAVTKGGGVKIGLLDTGVDATHPDLSGALLSGTDTSGSGASNGEKPVGDDPHGTNMAGFIVGRGHGSGGSQGMMGAAPEAKVMSASYGSTASVAPAFKWLVDHGAKVINMSFGGDPLTPSDIAYAQARDVVLVAATGNGGPLDSPSSRFGVVAVSGVLKGLTTIDSAASSGGPEFADTSDPTTADSLGGTGAAGPSDSTDAGQDMVSLTTHAKGDYTYTGGTSNATAVVTGIVALIRAAHPSMNAANVVNLLIRTSSLGKSGKVNTTVGFGVPDAYAAVTSTSVKTVCESPLGSEATKSVGFWPKLTDPSFTYTPKCSTSPSSTAPSSSASASSGGSGAASSAPSSAAAASTSDGSSGGVPVWVIVLIVVVVLGALAAILVLRGRGKRGGPGGPPAGGGYGPPPGGPGPYGGPPQGNWQQSGWQQGPAQSG